MDGEVAQSDVQVGASALEAVGLVEKIEFTVILGSNFVEFLLPISGQKSEEHVAHTRSLLPSVAHGAPTPTAVSSSDAGSLPVRLYVCRTCV